MARSIACHVAGWMVGACLISPLLFGSAQAQEPPLSVCNQSTYAVKAAVAVARRAQTTSRGWFDLAPGACVEALDQAPRRAKVFLFAQTRAAYAEGRRVWSGRVELCVDPEATFVIDDARACEDVALETRPFAEVTARPGAGGPRTVILAEPADYALSRARIAGAQRLLFELGHLDEAPDGLLGQGTRSAVRDFLGPAAGAWSGEIDDALIASLLDASMEKTRTMGLSVCNDGERDIWAALGEARDMAAANERAAKGWWRVEPGACRRIAAGPLDADVIYHVFAEMRDEADGALIAGGADQEDAARFCIDVVKFETGAANCAARGLIERTFRRLPAVDEDGRLTVRFDARDFGPPPGEALDG